MVTTIQITESVKEDLKKLKRSSETYEDVIVRLIKASGGEKMEKLLEEGYKEMAEDSKRINEEWEAVDSAISLGIS